MQLLVKLAVADLLKDVRVAGLVNLECFRAIGADDVVHCQTYKSRRGWVLNTGKFFHA